MNESSYTDMMNNIASYLDKYCGLSHDNKQEGGESVEDVLTELIHMNAPKDEQNGGVLIDDVMTNLTGGMVGGKNKTQPKPDIVEIAFKDVDMNLLEGGNKNNADDIKKQDETDEKTPKKEQQVNTEAIEAVANELSEEPTTTKQEKQQTKEQTETLAETPAMEQTAEQANELSEEQIEETPAMEQVENKPTIEQTKDKTNSDSSTSEDEDSYSDSSESSESDYSDDETEQVDISSKGSTYEAFLKHYSEHELTNTMKGGDNKERIANSKIHILPMFPYLLRY